MQAFNKFAASAAAVLTITAFASQADAAIFLAYSLDDGATFTAGTDLNGLDDVLNGFDIFGGFQISTNADAGVAPTLLNSTNIDTKFIGSGSGTIDIYVTRQGITGGMPADGYESSFTSNTLPTGWSVRQRTYVSGTNALYTGSLLGDAEFFSPGTDTQFDAAVLGGSPYSVTTRYTLSATAGAGSALSTVTLSAAAIPEPGTWGLMIIGFGSAGAMLRSRRRAQPAVA